MAIQAEALRARPGAAAVGTGNRRGNRQPLCRHGCPTGRLAWVLGFTMGPFGNIERPWKPFNPILGETFEYAKPAKGMKFIAEQVRCSLGAVGCLVCCVWGCLGESSRMPLPGPAARRRQAWRRVLQPAPHTREARVAARPTPARLPPPQVSHHPPVGAAHAESELWTFDQVSAPKTKFLGNSVEVYPIGAPACLLAACRAFAVCFLLCYAPEQQHAGMPHSVRGPAACFLPACRMQPLPAGRG